TSLQIPYSQQPAYTSAGYAPIVTNSTYTGGLVRQHGNLSFARVFQAGHEVPSYQPETAYRIFTRAIFGMDIATGAINVNSNQSYSTQGPSDSSGTKQQPPENPYGHQCYVLALGATCSDAEIAMVEDGSAVVKNYILVNGNESSSTSGGGGTVVEGPNNNLTGSSATGTVGMPRPTPTPFTGGAGKVEAE
ncbi:MAG: hypothetical protein Q9212_007605, partial [Teloschistes hypoglaucus]